MWARLIFSANPMLHIGSRLERSSLVERFWPRPTAAIQTAEHSLSRFIGTAGFFNLRQTRQSVNQWESSGTSMTFDSQEVTVRFILKCGVAFFGVLVIVIGVYIIFD